ncbi:hypothetical protein [Streptomyces sp. NBC_01296]|uniref:hypothetical protein n=1 Tax=Streptomyces sp. NBC_01296 TaxID=2903816 RepID=UPI002E0DBE96|nr:hypothetical protein OG299_01270 [Streptomyces sp. NBC_01296]
MADGVSVPAGAEGVPDGTFAGVDADGCEGFASVLFFAFCGPHPHATSATHADTATLTIVRVFIRSPPPADCPSRAHAGSPCAVPVKVHWGRALL